MEEPDYYGVDKIYNGGIQTLKMKSRMAASAYQENEQDQTTIQISANKRFRLQNEEGKYLEYDGNNYTGDNESLFLRTKRLGK